MTLVLAELFRRYRLAVMACCLTAVPTEFHTALWLAMHVVSSLFVAWLLCQADDCVEQRLTGGLFAQPKTLHSSSSPDRGQRPGHPPRII